ncbi:MAG: right-handed parallel beta-helix repeat-containing protein [Planctomycetota bacterium]|jgi:hypothetical protein
MPTRLLILLIVIPAFAILSCNIKGFEDSPYPTPWVIADTPAGTQQADATITYRMIEIDGIPADIALEYSNDGGATWLPATAKGGDGTTGIAGVRFPGLTRTIVWDTAADKVGGTQTCRVRITPSKSGVSGTPGVTDDFLVSNPGIPVISWIAKPEGAVRQLPLTFAWLLNTTSVPIASYYYGLDEDPPTTATMNTFVTIPAPSLGAHTFRVFAQSTFGFNSAVLVAPFTCDNAAANQPPSVLILDGPSGTTFDNTPSFEYIGGDADGFVAGYYISIDADPPDVWTAGTTWTSPELPEGGHTFYVMAQDNEGANSSIASFPFSISGIPGVGVIYVDGCNGDNSNDGLSWPTAVRTIQRGLDLAGNSGFLVLVADGEYRGKGNRGLLFRSKDIYLKSANGPDSCILDGEYSDCVINLNSSQTAATVVDGLTIRNGYAVAGGGISCLSNATILNCIFTENKANIGGGLWIDTNSSVTVSNCRFISNYAYDDGGGIACNYYSDAEISNCIIHKNRAEVGNGTTSNGGGIFARRCNLDVDNCTITENFGGRRGGGIYSFDNSNTRVVDSVIRANSSKGEAGICAEGNCTVINTRVLNNVASIWDGSGIGMYGGDLHLVNSVVAKNVSARGKTGGIHGGDRFFITNSIITNNFGNYVGGISLTSQEGCCYLNNSIIWGNFGDYYANEIRLYFASATLVLNHCDYADNSLNSSNLLVPGGAFVEVNCINSDPVLIDASRDNYRPGSSSSCFDAGCSAVVPFGIVNDADGNARIIGSSVDIGPYEWTHPAGNLAPIMEITRAPLSATQDPTPVFEYHAYDADGTVAGYFVSVDQNPPDTWVTSGSWNSSSLGFGAHTFFVMAQDNSGANSSIASAGFSVVSLAPSVEITGGPSGVTTDDTPTFLFLGNDAVGSITRYYVSVDDTTPEIETTDTFWTPFQLLLGSHCFYVKAQNDTGANSAVVSQWFHVAFVTDTIYVNDAGGDNANDGLTPGAAVKTIQYGIDLCGASGYSVQVADGTYSGAGNIGLDFSGKDIYLKSTGGSGACIIDCGYADRGIYLHSFESGLSIIDGFTIRNAYGGGVFCQADTVFIDCILDNNTTIGYGGGIYIESGCSPKMINCAITNNSAEHDGGGVNVQQNSHLYLNDCSILSNHATDGSGGAVFACGTGIVLTAIDTEFRHNTGYADAGGIWLIEGVMSLNRCIIDNNSALRKGGLGNTDGAICSVKNCHIIRNRASTGYGGGFVCASGGYAKIVNSVIAENYAADRGGGLYIFNNTKLDVINCVVTQNTANEGGGLYGGSYASFYNSIIWNNDAVSAGKQLTAWTVSQNIVGRYCCIADNALDPMNLLYPEGIILSSCINLDPQFSLPGNMDFRLILTSPCINAGLDAFVAGNEQTDLDGNPRIAGDAVDIGAYEYQP